MQHRLKGSSNLFRNTDRLLGESLLCTSFSCGAIGANLDIVAGYSSQRLLDGFVIVHALDIFRVDSVTVIVNGVHAIFRHDLLPKL
jgi:hypothetical protein